MAEEDSSRDIDRAAAEWAARLDRGLLTAGDEDRLKAWLVHDPRARGALLRAQALSMLSESAAALGKDFNPRAFEEAGPRGASGPSRRRMLVAAGGIIGVSSLGALGLGVSAAGAVTRTARGEIRLVPLEDGSTVLLNTLSGIRVDYDRDGRKVTLLDGEAYFSVAQDARPFLLDVRGQRLRATRANFRVRRLEDQPVDLLVSDGDVHVAANSAYPAGHDGEAVGANTRLILGSAGHSAVVRRERVAPQVVSRELAWREGKLAFEGEPLQQAVAAFARYSDTRIRIADGRLAQEPVTGLFAANDPVGFSRAVAQVFDAQLQVTGRTVVLARSASSG